MVYYRIGFDIHNGFSLEWGYQPNHYLEYEVIKKFKNRVDALHHVKRIARRFNFKDIKEV